MCKYFESVLENDGKGFFVNNNGRKEMKKKNEDYRAEYLKTQIVNEPEKMMEEFCVIAEKIYYLFKESGKEGLERYLIDSLNIENSQAKRIALAYEGEHTPEKIDVMQYLEKKSWNQIIEKLSLQLDARLIWPKNILAWEIIRFLKGEEYFSWEILGDSGKNFDNKILFPNYPIGADGNNLPIPLFAINAITEGEIPYHIRKKSQLILSELGEEIGVSLVKTFMEAKAIFPPKKITEQLIRVIKEGLSGKEVILTACVCPDYSYVKKSSNGIIRYEYTFEGLGSGVGVVAKQVQRLILNFDKFFKKFNINYRVVMSIADYEATKENCEAVGESKESFLEKCKISLENFKKELSGIPIITRMFESEWAFARFKDEHEKYVQAIQSGDYGKTKKYTGKDSKSTLKFIAQENEKFYKKWHAGITDEEIESLVISQAAEYAATGAIMEQDFKGCPVMQIAGDRPKMNIFNNFASSIPTICAERVY